MTRVGFRQRAHGEAGTHDGAFNRSPLQTVRAALGSSRSGGVELVVGL